MNLALHFLLKGENIMANIARIDPFSMSGIDPFEDVFKGFFRPVSLSSLDGAAAPQLKMDVEENESNYIVCAEIPGVDKENIQVTIDGSQVSISAEVRRENEVKDGERNGSKEGVRSLRSERYYGKVSRTFVLEHEVDEAQAEANYKDGVLQLTLPKKTTSSAKRLTIN
jgi:HSP20 family protein